MNYQDMIRELSMPVAPAGFETPIIEKLESLAREKGAETSRTALGNLVVHRPGTGKKIALVAHADTKGFVVLDKADNGFCRLGELGGHPLAACIGMPVRFANGARGIMGCDGGMKADCKITDMFVNVTSGEADLGDVCVAALPCYSEGDLIVSSMLNNRAGCAVLLDVLERTDTDADLYIIFTVQYELGQRGASSSVFEIQPDAVIVCECLPTSDTPGAGLKCTVKMGEGPVLPVKVGAGTANLALVAAVEKAGKDSENPAQRAVYPGGGTDMYPIQISCAGIYSCAVGIPTRTYGLMSMANATDLRKTADLLLAAVKAL